MRGALAEYPATIATVVRTSSMPTNVPGSRDVTPKSRPPAPCARTHDAAVPIVMPIAASQSVWRMIRVCTSRALAPSASRIPISWVR